MSAASTPAASGRSVAYPTGRVPSSARAASHSEVSAAAAPGGPIRGSFATDQAMTLARFLSRAIRSAVKRSASSCRRTRLAESSK